MTRLREHKRNMRRDLHQEMSVPALYIARVGATPVECTVRVHTRFEALGSLQSFPGAAERAEIEPRIIFLVSEIPSPRHQAIVSVEAGEAYRVVSVDRPEDITVTAIVTQMAVAETAALPVPA